MLYMADSYIKMNRQEDARPLLEKLVKIAPPVHGPSRYGHYLQQYGQKEDQLRELKTLFALKPDDKSAHWRLSRLYQSMGKTAEADAELAITKKINKAGEDSLLKVFSQAPQQDKRGKQPRSNVESVTFQRVTRRLLKLSRTGTHQCGRQSLHSFTVSQEIGGVPPGLVWTEPTRPRGSIRFQDSRMPEIICNRHSRDCLHTSNFRCAALRSKARPGFRPAFGYAA